MATRSPPRKRSRLNVVPETEGDARQALIEVMRRAGLPEEIVAKISREAHPPSDEEHLAATLMRAGLGHDAVAIALKEFRARQIPIMLTVVGREKADEYLSEGEESSDRELETMLLSRRFWISPGSTVGEASEETIATAYSQYFRFALELDEDSLEVWAAWADEWRGDYAVGVQIYPDAHGDASLLDFMIANLPKRASIDPESEGDVIAL